VAPDVAQLIAEGREQLADDDLGLSAVWALVIAVLDQRHGSVGATADVVANRIDVVREIDEVVGRAADLARADLGWESPVIRTATQAPPVAMSAPASTPSLASSRSCPRKAMLEISSETVKPRPLATPPAAITGQLSPRPIPRGTDRDTSAGPTTVPSDDPEG